MAAPPVRRGSPRRSTGKGPVITARLEVVRDPNAQPEKRPVALTIAGSDSSGGAGIQADLKTFSVLGVYGASVITALTAQNTRGVEAVLPIEPAFIRQQFDAVVTDLPIDAAKTGMLGTVDAVRELLAALDRHPIANLVVDPVMISTSGDTLLEPAAIDLVRDALVPQAAILTPNLAEAARLLDRPVATTMDEMLEQGLELTMLGAACVLMKGGHGEGEESMDVMVATNGTEYFSAPRLSTKQTHGTGCVLSAAITAMLALGADHYIAVAYAKNFVWEGISRAARLPLGKGNGPVDPLHAIKRPPTTWR